MARPHPHRNIWSVVVTEHDPALDTTTHTTWRIDLRAAGLHAGTLRRTIALAISILAQTAQDLPELAAKKAHALDEDIDGYPSGSSHLGRSSGDTDTVYAAATARIEDQRAEAVRIVTLALDHTIDAARNVRAALERLART